MEPENNQNQSMDQSQPSVESAYMDNTQAPKKKNLRLWILLAALLIVVAVGVYSYSNRSKSSDKPSTAQSTTTQKSSTSKPSSEDAVKPAADIDAEISAADKSLGAIDDNADFGAGNLSDAEVGI